MAKNEIRKVNRSMKKHFERLGLQFNYDEYINYRPEDDMGQNVILVNDDFIVCALYSAVLDPVYRFYDRHTLIPICEQAMRPEDCFLYGSNKWAVGFYES